jgi:hypothetical protein
MWWWWCYVMCSLKVITSLSFLLFPFYSLSLSSSCYALRAMHEIKRYFVIFNVLSSLLKRSYSQSCVRVHIKHVESIITVARELLWCKWNSLVHLYHIIVKSGNFFLCPEDFRFTFMHIKKWVISSSCVSTQRWGTFLWTEWIFHVSSILIQK